MTREEAITLLKKLRTFHNGTYAKTIDTAIEALTQDSRKVTQESDLISRQAVAIKSDDNSSIDKAKGFSVIW